MYQHTQANHVSDQSITTGETLRTASFFMSPRTMPKQYDDVFEEIFGSPSEIESEIEEQKESVQDKFEYHLKELKKMCNYIVDESSYHSENVMMRTETGHLLGVLNVAKININLILKHLTADMTERLFIEFCEVPI